MALVWLENFKNENKFDLQTTWYEAKKLSGIDINEESRFADPVFKIWCDHVENPSNFSCRFSDQNDYTVLE